MRYPCTCLCRAGDRRDEWCVDLWKAPRHESIREFAKIDLPISLNIFANSRCHCRSSKKRIRLSGLQESIYHDLMDSREDEEEEDDL